MANPMWRYVDQNEVSGSHNSWPLFIMNVRLVEQKVHASYARETPPVRPRYVVDVPWRDISNCSLISVKVKDLQARSFKYVKRF